MMDRVRKKKFNAGTSKPAIIYIGGVDADKFQNATGFNQYFRKNADPNEAEVVPLSDIINYEVEDLGTGYLNIAVTVRSKFLIPENVFLDAYGETSTSIVTYYIDIKGFSNNLGEKCFAGQANLTHFLLKGVQTISQQWNGRGGKVPRVLDFESATTIQFLAFDQYRNGNDRINVRNANNLIDNFGNPIAFGNSVEPDGDSIFYQYNFNLNPDAKKVIYVHKDLETINNGNPLDSLQKAINRNANVRFIDPVDVGLIVNTPVNPQIADIGATWVEFNFQDIADADFYEVWVQNYNDVIEQYFPIGEITNANKYIGGLDANRDYQFQLVARDYHYNNSVKSVATPQITTLSQDLTISEANVGGTYVELDIVNPSPYTINEVEVYVDGSLNTTIQGNLSTAYAINLQEQTTYDIDIIAKTDEGINLVSNQITATTGTIDTALLFNFGTSYHKQNELSGNAIDSLNNNDGVDVGTINKDSEWYDYGTNESYVEIPDDDGYSFVDAQGNNTDFVIKTTVIFDGFNNQNRAWLVSKRGSDVIGTTREWHLAFLLGLVNFALWDVNGNDVRISYSFSPVIGQKYILGVTLNGNQLDLFIDGVIVATTTISSGFQFFNGTAPVKLGNETFTSNLNLVGRQKETFIGKGQGWSAGDISDNYNNGNGTSI